MSRWLRIGAWGVGILLVLGLLVIGWIDRDRVDIASLDVPLAPVAEPVPGDDRVRVTWLGVTTLLFEDGETSLLVDGFFSRPGLLDLALGRRVAPDIAAIEAALSEADVPRLDAVFAVHSHYDHAMDSGEVARRTGAVVLGSRSTANAARGAGLGEDRIVVVEPGRDYPFGRFRVRFVESRHMPVNEAGDPPFPGTIDAPLVPPQPVSAWRMGGAWSIVIAHPRGSALVQGSAGFVEGALAGVEAEVVLLGVGGLSRLGRPYTEQYWNEIVAASAPSDGATRVLPVHWDDFFSRPYGEVIPPPRRFEDLGLILAWLSELAASRAPPATIELLPFGERVVLF